MKHTDTQIQNNIPGASYQPLNKGESNTGRKTELHENDPLLHIWYNSCNLEKRRIDFANIPKNIQTSNFFSLKCVICSQSMFTLQYPLLQYPWVPLDPNFKSKLSPSTLGTFLIPSSHIPDITFTVQNTPKYIVIDSTFVEMRFPVFCSVCSCEIGYAPNHKNIPYYRIYSFSITQSDKQWKSPNSDDVQEILKNGSVQTNLPGPTSELNPNTDSLGDTTVLCSVHNIPRKMKHCSRVKKQIGFNLGYFHSNKTAQYEYSCLSKYNCLKERKKITGGVLSEFQERQLEREMRAAQRQQRLASAASKFNKQKYSQQKSAKSSNSGPHAKNKSRLNSGKFESKKKKKKKNNEHTPSWI